MVSSEFNYIEYLYIHVGMDSIVFNDDINFQFDAKAMTSSESLITSCMIKNSDSSLLYHRIES